jgi:hypothetical protein
VSKRLPGQRAFDFAANAPPNPSIARRAMDRQDRGRDEGSAVRIVPRTPQASQAHPCDLGWRIGRRESVAAARERLAALCADHPSINAATVADLTEVGAIALDVLLAGKAWPCQRDVLQDWGLEGRDSADTGVDNVSSGIHNTPDDTSRPAPDETEAT